MTYNKKYDSETYYWGKEPSASGLNLLKFIQSDKVKPLSLLDMGCGEGRNSVYFAENNFKVTAVDISQTGLDKTIRLAKEKKTSLITMIGDIKNIVLSEKYDVIFSSGTVHYLPPEIRDKQFKHIQQQTNRGGIHSINVFVKKTFVAKAPDAEESAFLYKSGELLGYYADWEILFSSETIFDCMSGGKPHKHAMNSIVAQKVIE